MSYLKIVSTVFILLLASLAQAQTSERGRQQFEQCIACHSLQAGDHQLGPSLAGILNQRAGSTPGFRFSGAMKNSGVIWNRATLQAFIADPQAMIPGNRMPFSGMDDVQARNELLLYLQTALKPASH